MKSESDRLGIWEALLDNRIDVIATDHAPHTIEEKSGNYWSAPSGGPLVQHSILAMMDFVNQGKITQERMVEKMSHAVADLFQIRNRGYIRKGYFADLVLVDPKKPTTSPKTLCTINVVGHPLKAISFRALSKPFLLVAIKLTIMEPLMSQNEVTH